MTLSLGKSRVKHLPIEGSANQVLEALFEEHWERIFSVIFRLVGDRAEAEDLALEVFWRLYQHPPKSKDPGPLRGWLYRVATNLGYNALRAEKRRVYYERQAAREEAMNTTLADPAAQYDRVAERQRVREALSKLKPRAAKLLVLRHSGLSYQEIAQALQVAPGSVGNLLSRAEKSFIKHYQALEGR
jgi:RNA polymerase sigma-70 factor (ECF subfamily)